MAKKMKPAAAKELLSTLLYTGTTTLGRPL
jgi:hypothetical protein